jgi:GDP-mannose pyrophosphatase NudK
MSKIKIKEKTILSQGWSTLQKLTYEYQTDSNEWQTQTREAYDRGNGITVLLYNKERSSIILTRQFRIPTYLNGNATGMMIETCAGKLENENPEAGMIREIEEETGYRIPIITKIFEAYMSPGSVTELLHFFIASYDERMRVSKGGGLDSEQENIEVLEMSFKEALEKIKTGDIKDAKTIMLLQYARINLNLEY